ncbi:MULTISPECIES: YbaB/EbfC family nucleoid-associated protein [Nonomuraea]|uniref:DNA-binding protein YbaB n=2 Tax=Nonomuraea TaxID=83681 RepID=A0A7W5V148_9ACTN|nr:YbaB/EbfC family nucleoid-associated protein [Nonomuraea dietziae]MBB3728427.1 DNA-binding protein YbaB [Nonomuraea dietziae]
MQDFGDFANLDIDKLLKTAEEQFSRVEEVQKTMAELVGKAKDEDGLVTAEYTSAGLTMLELHPKAMRLGSGELADKVKAVVQEATADLQRQVNETMGEMFGEDENPMKFISNPDAALEQVKNAEAAYNRTFEDVMGELDKIRRRLDL